MRRSEFERALSDEFGARAAIVSSDLVIGVLGGRTPAQALAAGVPPREIWLAICEEMDVPGERRYGVGRLEPKRR